MDYIVKYYENTNEDTRITTDNARRIEFTTTVKVLDELIHPKCRIFDVAAGTGVYSIYYAERGHKVVATDLTPKHIEILNEKLSMRSDKLNIKTAVNNAVDLSKYQSETFDIVLCFGPIYHLINEEQRKKCISECLRVLKRGGLLAVAYVNKYFILPTLMVRNIEYVKNNLVEAIINKGIIKHDDEDCFWTDAYFATPEEINKLMNQFDIEVVDHLATDGISPMLREKVNELNKQQYEAWFNYHYKTCREQSILGLSNHGLYICRKR